MADRLYTDSLFLAKLESVSGTDATPAAATDALRLADLFDPEGGPSIASPRDQVVRGTFRTARTPLSPSGSKGNWKPKLWVRGAPTTGAYSASVKPHHDVILQIAGFAATGSFTAGAEKWTYTLATNAPLKTASCYYYLGGTLRKLLGTVANFTETIRAGMPAELDIDLTGLYQTPTATATPTGAVFGTALEPIADNLAFSLNGQSGLVVREFSWSTGSTVVERQQVNTAGALAYPRLTYAKPTWKATIEDPPIGTIDLEGLWRSATPFPLTWTLGTTQYNKEQGTAAAAVITDYKVSNDNGIPVCTISGMFGDSTDSATDAITLVYA